MTELSRRDFLKGLGAAAAATALGTIAGCSEPSSSTAASTAAGIYTPGTYSATAKGISSDVKVTMTFDANSITDVQVDTSGETASIGAAAQDTLQKQLLDAGSAEIDGVSGATITSNAVKQAAADCIAQAKGVSSTAAPSSIPDTASYAPYDKIPAAYLNPQTDESEYRTNTKELKTLFSPLTIGSINLTHRMVKTAAGSATYLAGLTDELLDYYVNLAKGGLELIYVEEVAALEPDPNTGKLSDEALAFGKKLSEECGKYGASLGYQWAVFGGGENDYTVDEIKALEDTGVAIAQGLKDMGFKAIEMNAAGFNLGGHFISRIYNQRTDEYGGSIENRARFITEWIQKVKSEVGEDFNVQILMHLCEEDDNFTHNPTLMTLDNAVTNTHTKVLTTEEAVEFAKLFEKAGADSLHLRLGPLGYHVAQFAPDLFFILNGVEGATGFGTQYDFSKNWEGRLIADKSGMGAGLDMAAEFKKAVSIPVGVVSYMDPAHAPDYFEQALEDGKCDFFMMNRPFTVDNEYVNKLRDGRIDEIAPCTRCLYCHIGSNEANAQAAYCRVNALTQRVMREGGPSTYELPEASEKKKVMVVGGGPAGMEAARILGQRGHEVTLYDKNDALGGLLDFASTVKGPHENLQDLKKYLIRQCELAGVTVNTGTEVTADTIAKEAPDAVVLACGGARQPLDISGANVVEMEGFMNIGSYGDNVIVYGSNAQAIDAALYLTVHKKNVVVVTPDTEEQLDQQQSQHAQRVMMTALYGLGVRVIPEASIASVSDGAAVVKSNAAGVSYSIKCDAVINGQDMAANTDLMDNASKEENSLITKGTVNGVEAYAIGDCSVPWNIGYAIRSGNDVGRMI